MSFEQELADDQEYYDSFLLGRQVDVIMGDALITYEITNPVELLINLDITKEDLYSLDKAGIINLVEEKMYDVKGNVKGTRLNRIKVDNPVTKEDKKFLEELGIPVEELGIPVEELKDWGVNKNGTSIK